MCRSDLMFLIPSAPESTFPTFPFNYHIITEHCKGKRKILNLIVVLVKKIIDLSNSMTSQPVNVRDWIPIFFFFFILTHPFYEMVCTDGVAKTKTKEKWFSMSCIWKMGCWSAGWGHLCPRWMSPTQLTLGQSYSADKCFVPHYKHCICEPCWWFQQKWMNIGLSTAQWG